MAMPPENEEQLFRMVASAHHRRRQHRRRHPTQYFGRWGVDAQRDLSESGHLLLGSALIGNLRRARFEGPPALLRICLRLRRRFAQRLTRGVTRRSTTRGPLVQGRSAGREGGWSASQDSEAPSARRPSPPTGSWIN
jgi:hypothetical protein